MSKKIKRYDNGERDYGLLSDASQSANRLLGDDSGRSISLRTGHGLKRALNSNISDDNAVHIAHAGMVASGVLVFKSKNDGGKLLGFALILFLFFCYQAGKQEDDELLIY